MEGYGYGVWLELEDERLKRMIADYNEQPFQPHVTVLTNIDSEERLRKHYARLLIYNGAYHHVRIQGKSTIFPTMYTYDPLHAWGFTISSETLPQTQAPQPHLTISYSAEPFHFCPDLEVDFTVQGILKMYDTRDRDPHNWSQVHVF